MIIIVIVVIITLEENFRNHLIYPPTLLFFVENFKAVDQTDMGGFFSIGIRRITTLILCLSTGKECMYGD